jgi:predicted nucleic acid-binding Zn ribbon protein
MSSENEQSILPGVEVIPDDACYHFKICGNTVPHDGEICAECLDRVRERDRKADHR